MSNSFAQEEFEKQQDTFDEIKNIGFAQFVKNTFGGNFAKAFDPKDRFVRCIDEGCFGGINLAGSGILLGLDKAEELLENIGIEGITYHSGCGAANLAFQKLAEEDKNALIDSGKFSTPDDYGKGFAKALAKRLEVPFKHIGFGEGDEHMSRDPAFHNARIIYYDGTGVFTDDHLAELPQGFVISRRHVGKEIATAETEVAIAIATGDHGFGNLINNENPLYLVVVEDPSEEDYSAKKLMPELQKLVEKSMGKVVLDSVSMPLICPDAVPAERIMQKAKETIEAEMKMIKEAI